MANRRLLVAALCALVLVASACSTSTNGVPSLVTPTVGSSANPSPANPSGFPSSAFSTSTGSGGATAPASSAAGAGSNASGPIPGDRSQPGGDAGARSYLAQKGWLDASGRVLVEKFSEENDEDVDDDSAFCNYVFGTLSQVQEAAKLASSTKFEDDDSGDDGSGSIACAYSDTNDDDAFILAIGVATDVEADQEGGAGLVAHRIGTSYESALGYAPGTSVLVGETAGAAWLTAAAARVDLTGVTKDS
jgi:hypothetical protein